MEEVIEFIESEIEGGARSVFHRFPVSDWLHLVKNLRQRVRNHTLKLTPEAPPIDAATFEDLLRPAVLSVPGQMGAISDSLAKELLTPDVLAAAFETGNCTAPIFVAPWTFVATAMDSETMTREARLEAISVAFTMFSRIYLAMGEVSQEVKATAGEAAGMTKEQMKAAKDAVPKERGGATDVLTISDRNHLRRVMNLCVGLFYIIKTMPGALLLGRFGTHSIESHFGIVRSALRGQGQWRYWLGAEAYANLVSRMKAELGLRPCGRAGRIAMSGCYIPGVSDPFDHDDAYIDPLPWTTEGPRRRDLLFAAFKSVEGDRPLMEVIYSYTFALVAHIKERPIPVESGPSPQAGMGSAVRYSRPAPVWDGA